MANWLYWGLKPVCGEEYNLHPYYRKQVACGRIASFFGFSCFLIVTVPVIVVGIWVIPSTFTILVIFGFAFYARVCGRSIFRVVRSHGKLAPNLEADVRRCREAVRRRDTASTPWQRSITDMRAFILWAVMARPLDEDDELKALGDACIVSYDTSGQMELLEEALGAYERCLQLRPSGRTLHGIAVRDLSLALWQYCRDKDGDVTRLDQCLKLLCKTVHLHPTAHDVWMPYYASALEMWFKRTPQQDLTILVESINLYRETLRHWFFDHPAPTTRDFLNEFLLRWRLLYQKPELWPTPRPSQDVVLSQLGCALLIIFREQGNLNTLEEAITLLRRALQLRQQGHPARHLSLHHLAAALHVLCEERGDSTVSDEAILLYEEALRLSNGISGDGSRGVLLDGFGIALITSFRFHRDLDVLTKSVLMLEEALQLHPRGHSARGASLSHLGDALRVRAEERGDWNALADAISRYREALQSSPGMGHDPVRDESLNGLGIALLVRFRQTGSLDILTEAIVSHREALQLQRSAHHSRGFALNYLALGLVARSHQQGGLADLDEAIELLREAVRHCRSDHPIKADWLNNLAGALQVRFERQGGIEILEEAVALHREALGLHPAGHSARDNALSSLGSALQTRFEQQGDRKMLEEAIAFHREALNLYPGYHPGRYIRLNSLARALKTLFNHAGEVDVLNQAIDMYREASQLCPGGHPHRAHSLFGLGECLLTRQADQVDFIHGIASLSEALAHFTTGVWERLVGAVASLRVVEREHTASLKRGDASRWTHHAPHILKLYRRAVQLLPLAANFGLDPRTRLEVASGSDELSRRGAARAVLINDVAEAVEMLEEGRGLFWSQLLHLRSSALDGLPEDDRRKLEGMFRDLETTSNTFIAESERDREQRLEQRRLLNAQTEEMIAKIRAHYPGFDRLLMPPAFDELMSSLPEGFVVIVNTARPSHHALLLHGSSGLATSVKVRGPRGGFDCNAIRANMPRDLGVDTKETEHETVSGDRGTNIRREQEFDSFDDVLAGLWERLVQPVIVSLGLEPAAGRDRPRIWWCVTGELSFLPLHAAGRFKGANVKCLSDFAVSSYIPTLLTLNKARRDWVAIPRADVTGVLLGEPAAPEPGAARLPGVTEEVDLVRQCFEAAHAQVVNTPSEHTTCVQMRSLLTGHPTHILHLASHGTQARDPLKSAFLLHDGRFSIEDIRSLELPHAVLAFLSACETAKGDRHAPDQAVHLAASMLFCGFRSVIGTMWLMGDKDGPKVARWFYERLFDHEALDLDDIAYALDDAVCMLRDTGAPAEHWALFVHMGG